MRLVQGDYARCNTYYDDPLDAAMRFADAGLRRLHMVDLDGAKRAFPANLGVLERVAARTGLEIQYGGGIKSREALDAVFGAGAARAICGSAAVAAPDDFRAWLDTYGAGRIILGADIKDGCVATHGWLDTSRVTAEELIGRFPGLRQVICTDISRDGMLCGPATELYTRLGRLFPALDITASGGIGSLSDILELGRAGIRSVVVGKALYEGKITLTQIASCLQNG